MKQQMLSHGWRLMMENGEEIPTRIPCSVYSDLLRCGKIEDPYYRDNETRVLPLMEKDYTYRLRFDADPELLACRRVLLRCEGLDTLAVLTLNGQTIGRADNMHRAWEFSVKDALRQTGNELSIVFESPTRYLRDQVSERGHINGSAEAMEGFPYLRKAHCMFGWDWGPRLPDAGIWRDISLIGVEQARLIDFHIRQSHTPGQAVLSFETLVEGEAAGYTVSLTDPDGRRTVYEGSPRQVTVTNPRLWWPNGYGDQPLYTVRAELLGPDGGIQDVWEKRIGLRTVAIRREKDAFGECFAHEVNGVAIFAMGADYIPEDCLIPRADEARTRRLLEQCAAARHNVIRVWGGGYYPSDWFYDICDSLGLLVWQDMMFACAVYDLTDGFEESLRAEFTDNIRRIRHHACLGLWCGNNEIEGFIADDWPVAPRQRADYTKLFEYILPRVLREMDPDTPYWPSSPSSGGAFDNPQDETRGDVHYWQVWHGGKPFTDYRSYYFRYASEFGFQSFPAMKTIEAFTLPEDRNVFSYVMEKHQRNNAANGKIMQYLSQTFLYPTRFDTLVYASQLLQAEAIRYGVEHWRRNRGRCMGAVVWQLNDCWPVASWSSIDYFGRWKALHYYEKRFFAPILLSCCEEGLLTQDPNPNAEPYEAEKSFRLNVANETLRDQRVIVRWTLRNSRSEILAGGGETALTVPKLSSVWLDKVSLPQADLFSDYVSFECLQDGRVISGGTAIFSVPKHFHFVDPELSARVEGDEIIVSSKAYARGVELLNADEDWILSDNYFDMDAGERRVKILSGEPDGVRIRSVYDIR